MTQYRPEIDGLRAIAVVPVVLVHAGYSVVSGGFLGVDIFFVISGFLITGIILAEVDKGDFSLLRFYERRARRILPALFAVLLVTSVFAFLWQLPKDLADYARSVLAALTFTSNIYFWQTIDYFSPDATLIPLLHLWSLGVEEQFYLGFPFVLMLMAGWARHRRLVGLMALLLASLIACEVGRRIWPTATFYLIPFRAWELLAGACLAVAMPRLQGARQRFGGVAAFLGMALIGASLFLFDKSVPTPSVFVVAPVLGTVLILAFAGQDNWVGKALSLWPVRFIGLISFSAYLWHQPVIAFAKIQPIGELPKERSMTVIISFALAAISWYLVEQPFRKGRLAAHPFRMAALGTSALAAIAAGLLLMVWQTPNQLPAYAGGLRDAGKEIVEYAARGRGASGCNDDLLGEPMIKSCRFGVDRSTPDIIVWGDSYADALLPGLREVALERGLSGVAYVRAGCPPVVGLDLKTTTECEAYMHRAILDHILQTPGKQPVFLFGNLAVGNMGNWTLDGLPATPEMVHDQIGLTRLRLNQRDKRLFFVEQGPRFRAEAARFYFVNLRRGVETELTQDRARHDRHIGHLEPLRDKVDSYISTTDLFCGPRKCSARDSNGRLVVHDKDHVTHLYARKLAERALAAIDRAKTTEQSPETAR